MSFRLTSLLKVRRLQADAAAARAGAATAAAGAAHRHAQDRRAELASMVGSAGHAGSVDARSFQAGVAARATRASTYTESVADAAQADGTALEQRGEWARARRAVRALERLEVKHLQEQNAAALAAEQVVLDEHGTRSRAAAVRDARRAADTADATRPARPADHGDAAGRTIDLDGAQARRLAAHRGQGRIARLSGQLPRAAVGAAAGAATGAPGAGDGASALAKSAGATLAGAGAGTRGAFADALAAVTRTAAAAGATTAGATTAGAAAAGGITGTGAGVVASAMKHLGLPYLWGGTDPKKGLDCSGLVQLAMRENGVSVPRTSQAQATVGTAVPSLDQARPGDLVVLHGGAHIGIYVGDGKMVHAPKTGDVVKVSTVWETPMTIRRVLPEAPAAGVAGLVGATASANGATSGATSAAPTLTSSLPPALAAALRVPAPGSGPSGAPAGAAPYQQLFDTATAAHGLPPGLLSAVADAESAYDPRAVSPVGARGLMQIMPATARGLGVDPMDPAQAVDGAARLLAAHLKTFGSVPLALAAYNAGPGNVQRYGGIPPFAETQSYVRRITAAQEAA